MRDGGGAFVVITPVVGMSGAAELGPYSAAVEGVRLLAKSAARQWGADRHPGELPRARARARADRRRERCARARRRRLSGGPGDIEVDLGPIVAWLLSDDAHFVTGVDVVRRRRRLDGTVSAGRVMTSAGRARRLDGRTAIVTGAGQGVGRGIALALAGEGANVVIAARRAETGEPVAEEIRGRGDAAVCIETDCTDARRDGGVRRRRPSRSTAGSRSWCTTRSAVAAPTGSRTSTSTCGTRTRAPRRGGRTTPRRSRTRTSRRPGSRGRLVLVTSPAGVEGSGGIPVYGPVKAAQRALAKSLAREWGPLGVTVNCIAPVAETPALAYAFDERPELKTASRNAPRCGASVTPSRTSAASSRSSPATPAATSPARPSSATAAASWASDVGQPVSPSISRAWRGFLTGKRVRGW